MKRAAVIVSVVMLGALTAFAGTISVPQFSDGGGNVNSAFFPTSFSATFIALKNNTGATQTYTVLYYGLDGANRTPSPNTFTIAANASIGWRPVAVADPAEISGVPDATGTAGAGSATILYSDTIDPSGRVVVNAAASTSSYAFAMFPAQ